MSKISKITLDQLDHIAYLARIKLTELERQSFMSQLESVLGYFDILKQADTSNVKPSFQITNLTNITRPDTILPSFSQKKALSGAPRSQDGYFQVHNTIKK